MSRDCNDWDGSIAFDTLQAFGFGFGLGFGFSFITFFTSATIGITGSVTSDLALFNHHGVRLVPECAWHLVRPSSASSRQTTREHLCPPAVFVFFAVSNKDLSDAVVSALIDLACGDDSCMLLDLSLDFPSETMMSAELVVWGDDKLLFLAASHDVFSEIKISISIFLAVAWLEYKIFRPMKTGIYQIIGFS